MPPPPFPASAGEGSCLRLHDLLSVCRVGCSTLTSVEGQGLCKAQRRLSEWA